MSVPRVYIFNSTCDFAVGNSNPSWQANQMLQKMEHDLGNLPQFLCKPNDIVIVQKYPSSQLVNILSDAGFEMPQFRKIDELHTITDIDSIHPWGWSPATHQLLKDVKAYCSKEFLSSAVASWKPEHRELYSRSTARKFLKSIISDYNENCFIGMNSLPRVCSSVSEIEEVAELWGKIMIKQPWSSSGRGLQPVTKFPIHQSVKQRISGMLKDQGKVFVEPLHSKILDLGFLYEITSDKVKWLGVSRFCTNDKGQYKGNYLNGFPPDFPDELVIFLEGIFEKVPQIHINLLGNPEIQKIYQGPLGIDMLIYRDIEGKLKINPCLEINWRFTMGHIALQLEQHLCIGAKAIFRIYYDNKKPFSVFASENIKQHPLKLSGGKIESGFIPLTDITEDSLFGAYMITSNSPWSPSF